MTGMKICNNNNRCAVILGDDCGTAEVQRLVWPFTVTVVFYYYFCMFYIK